MVSSAIETYINHMENLNLSDNYYDLVITGDLSKVGSELFIKGINELGHNIKNYNDCGLIIYDRDIQDVNMGGSGCATIALVMFGYIIKLMKENQYKKVLIIGTGALINKVLTLQNKGIPSISYAIGIEI
jgi:stage V sporulation protein AD